MPEFKACGHYLSVKLEKAPSEQVSSGGIILSQGIDSKKKEQAGMSYAKVVSIGANCWVGHYDPDGEWSPWCKEGDTVMIAQYAGQSFPIIDSESGDKQDKSALMRLIKDDDVLMVVGGDS